MRYLLVLVLSYFLLACSTTGPVVPTASKSLKLTQITALKQWTLEGQLAFNDTSTQRGFSASIHWLNDQSQNHLDVIGPLGLWHATLSDNATSATLQLSDGRQFTAKSLESLMQANLDWYLPVASLHYWLFAVPQPNVDSTIKRDSQGQVTDLSQAGWQIHYADYQRIDGYVVPKRMELTKGALRIRFAIQRWQLML